MRRKRFRTSSPPTARWTISKGWPARPLTGNRPHLLDQSREMRVQGVNDPLRRLVTSSLPLEARRVQRRTDVHLDRLEPRKPLTSRPRLVCAAKDDRNHWYGQVLQQHPETRPER